MSLFRNPLFAALTPVVVGAILAFFVMVGLVMSKAAAPDQNPAAKSALVYGE